MKDVPRLGHTVQVLIKKLRVCHYVMDSVLWGASGGVLSALRGMVRRRWYREV